MRLRIPLFGGILLGLIQLSSPAFAGELGVYAGLSRASVAVEPEAPTESVLGYLLGVRYELPFRRAEKSLVFSVVPGLQFAERGYGSSVNSRSVDFYTDYLEVPVLLKLSIPRENEFTPYFVFGPNFGLRVRTSCSIAGTNCSVLDEANLAKTQTALEIGGGLDFALANGRRIAGEFRYFHGLSDTLTTATTLKNRGLQFIGVFYF
jgi:hypothetical protein